MLAVEDRGATDLAALHRRALDGDEHAWRSLVDALKNVAWKVLNSYGISAEDRNDAFASTFFRLFERLGTIREPLKLPGWVATTARNEANAAYRRQARVQPMADLPVRPAIGADPAVAEHSERLEHQEVHAALRGALGRLSAEHQALLRLLCADPPIPYDDIARLMDMPIGSIGPTRQRLLARLRNSPELAAFLPGSEEPR